MLYVLLPLLLCRWWDDGSGGGLGLKVAGAGSESWVGVAGAVGLKDVGLTDWRGWARGPLLHWLVDGKDVEDAVEAGGGWHAAVEAYVAVEVRGYVVPLGDWRHWDQDPESGG